MESEVLFRYESQDVKGTVPLIEDMENVHGSSKTKGVPVDALVVNDVVGTASPNLSADGSPRNVKLFNKNRGRVSGNGSAAGLLPTIIGGSDLVPHKKLRVGTQESSDDEEEDRSTSLSAWRINGGKEIRSGRVTHETRSFSPNLNQGSTSERGEPSSGGNQMTDERGQSRKTDDNGRGIGTGAEGSNRVNQSDESGGRSRPRRTIVSLF